jgi:toxin ParE1/3/4
MKIVVSQKADADLLRIFAYVFKLNPVAADALIQDINRKFEQLGHFPFLGRERASLFPGLRSVIVGNYLFFIWSRMSTSSLCG